MLKKIQNYYNELRLESIDEVYKYRLTITFKDGRIVTIDTDRYYLKPRCSFSEYFMIFKEDRLCINGEFCPTYIIESITDEIIETEIIYVKEGFISNNLELNDSSYCGCGHTEIIKYKISHTISKHNDKLFLNNDNIDMIISLIDVLKK